MRILAKAPCRVDMAGGTLKKEKSFESLAALRAMALYGMRAALEQSDWNVAGRLLREEWSAGRGVKLTVSP
jgi:hypothetical protein